MTMANFPAINLSLDSVVPKVKPPAKKTDLVAPVSSLKPPVLPAGIDAEELKKFQGKWKAVVLADHEKELTADEVGKAKVEYRFTGTSVEIIEGGKTVERATIEKLDAVASPKIVFLQPGGEAKGAPAMRFAYGFEGSRLKIYFDLLSKDPPKALAKPKPGDKSGTYIELEKGG